MPVRLIASLALAAVLTLAGAGSVAAVVVTDGTGATITLAAPARSIVSLAPSATELLYAAGAGDRVVAVTDPTDWPPEARALPRIGDARTLDLEKIVGLRPDLAVAWPYVAAAQIARLEALGIPVYRSDPHTPDAIAVDIERLGVLAGSAEAAAAAAARFRSRLEALRRQRHAASTVRVFYEIWNQPLYTVGGAHLITAAIALCGGENVFSQLSLPAPSVSVEAVLAARPSAIIAGTDGALRPAWLDAWRQWTDLPAVARGNLFVVDANLLHRPGPRFVDGAEALCAVIDRARANSAR